MRPCNTKSIKPYKTNMQRRNIVWNWITNYIWFEDLTETIHSVAFPRDQVCEDGLCLCLSDQDSDVMSDTVSVTVTNKLDFNFIFTQVAWEDFAINYKLFSHILMDIPQKHQLWKEKSLNLYRWLGSKMNLCTKFQTVPDYISVQSLYI